MFSLSFCRASSLKLRMDSKNENSFTRHATSAILFNSLFQCDENFISDLHQLDMLDLTNLMEFTMIFRVFQPGWECDHGWSYVNYVNHIQSTTEALTYSLINHTEFWFYFELNSKVWKLTMKFAVSRLDLMEAIWSHFLSNWLFGSLSFFSKSWRASCREVRLKTRLFLNHHPQDLLKLDWFSHVQLEIDSVFNSMNNFALQFITSW